jgi:ABC-type sugar transport system ATPase subunit
MNALATSVHSSAANRAAPSFLSIRDMTKRYPGVTAAEGVSLEFRSGEVLGLVGKNGAGKSTVIKMLAGVTQPDAGQMLLEGRAVHISGPHHASRLGLAFVFQELADVPALSVAENLELGLGYPRRGPFIDWVSLRARTRVALEQVGLDLDPRTPMNQLSVASRKLVAIARALHQNSRLVVLDEPSASLTDAELRQLFSAVNELRGAGVSVVYVSHRLEEIMTLTQRVAVMRDGHLVLERETASLTLSELVGAITGDAALELIRHPTIPARGELLLEAENICLAGRLQDVSLKLYAGEIVGLAGLVGAGRSELVRALFGAETRSSGTVRVRGVVRRLTSPQVARKAGLALLPEDRRHQGLNLSSSIRENITLPSLEKYRAAPWLPSPLRRLERLAASRYIERLAIRTPSAEKPTGQLSGGNQQKVVLAKWLEHGADVFFFDEPTHGIDVQAKAEVYRVMEELAAQGKGIVFISSEFPELVGVCHRVLVLREGRVVAELEGDAISEDALVAACYREG